MENSQFYGGVTDVTRCQKLNDTINKQMNKIDESKGQADLADQFDDDFLWFVKWMLTNEIVSLILEDTYGLRKSGRWTNKGKLLIEVNLPQWTCN